MRLLTCSLFALALFAGVRPAAAAEADVVAGPMVGHVTDKMARLWMQLSIAGGVKVTVFDAAERNAPVSALKFDVEGPSPFICDVPLSGLSPNHTYRVEAEFEGHALALPGPPLIIRTAPAPGSPEIFSVGVGSDLYIAPPPPAADPAVPGPFKPADAAIFRAITDLKPRAFLFLGNTGYLPDQVAGFPKTNRAAYRSIVDMHATMRQIPDLQELFRTTPCYSVYDERDFGPWLAPADGPNTFPFADEALVAFERYWPSPDWGTPQAQGCFCSFACGDVDFFLLDTRKYRTSKGLLGDAQIAWLEKGLKASRATFKVIASARPLFAGGDAKLDEEKSLLGWMGESQIDGLLMATGNQKAGELLSLEKPGAADGPTLKYPLLTLVCSNLTDLPAALQALAALPGDHVGDIVEGKTFGTLDFGGPRDHRFVTLRVRDAEGKAKVEQTVTADQLMNR